VRSLCRIRFLWLANRDLSSGLSASSWSSVVVVFVVVVDVEVLGSIL
jgi:hypothetical protein